MHVNQPMVLIILVVLIWTALVVLTLTIASVLGLLYRWRRSNQYDDLDNNSELR